MVHTTRRGAAGRAVFWLIALAVIGGLGYFVWMKKQPPVSENRPVAAELAAYLGKAHKEAWDPSMDVSFGVAKVIADVYPACVKWFGQDVTFDELKDSGYEFKGGGDASVPGAPDPNLTPGQSAQFRLVTDGTKGAAGARVSLFLQKYRLPPNDDGSDILGKKTAYSLKAGGELGKDAPPILVYRDGGIVYFAVTETPGGYDALKQAFGWPEPSGAY